MINLVGQTIGQYQLIELVSQGENTVYKGFQPSINRYVAVKILNPARSADPAFVSQFRRDMQTIVTLEHPNILPIYDYGQQNGLLYIVTQYVEEGSLNNQLPYFYPLGQTRQLIVPIAEALAYIHSRGLIHGNLKPTNILVDSLRRPFLADFGYTQGIDIEGADRAYLSPEQLQGILADQRTDVYALGALLHHMTVGTPPPVGVLPSPRLSRPDLPMDVEMVILKALAQDPTQRFQTAAEFNQAIQMAIPGPAVWAGPPATPEPQQSSNRLLWIIGGVALLALLACAIFFFGFGGFGDSGSSEATAVIPTPAPAVPSITARSDANIRSGPGQVYDIIGLLKTGQSAEAIGRSSDQQWWAIKVAAATTGQGWVSNDLVDAQNVDNVPVLQAPPTPTPVEVKPQPPQAVIDGTTRAQAGQPVSFTARNSTVAEGSHLVTFGWDFGDGATATGVDVTHSYSSPGRYTVQLTVTDDKNLSGTNTLRVQISEAPVTPEPEQPPEAVISGPGAAEVGETVTFDARSSQGANRIVSYAWDLGDGTTANAVEINHVYNTPGVYNVILTVTDDKNLSGTSNVQINITAAPPEPEPTETPSPSGDLENVEWVLNGTLPDTEITALFQNGTVSGSTGCNTYTSTYQVDGNNILIGQPTTSQMACTEEIMNQESRYLTALTSAQRFEVGQLGRLTMTGGERMTFSAR